MRFPMNGRMGTPAAQVVAFRCRCGSIDFETVSLTRLSMDRLDLKKVLVAVRPAYRCLGCGGWVQKAEDGTLSVEPQEGAPGEEWKG